MTARESTINGTLILMEMVTPVLLLLWLESLRFVSGNINIIAIASYNGCI